MNEDLTKLSKEELIKKYKDSQIVISDLVGEQEKLVDEFMVFIQNIEKEFKKANKKLEKIRPYKDANPYDYGFWYGYWELAKILLGKD